MLQSHYMMRPESYHSPESNELSKIDTSNLIAPIEEYKKKFNWGVVAAKRITGKEDSDADYDSTEEVRFYESMKADARPILKLTGLEFDTIKTSSVLVSKEANFDFKEIILRLEDGAQFVKYLQSLTVENITESQANGLSRLAKIITRQLKKYDLNNPNDSFFQLISNLPDIISEYDRLGFSEIDEFESFLEHAKKGCLKEFMAAGALKLDRDFEKGRGFVLEWHRDATPEILQKYWNNILDVLIMISNNEKAKDVYGRAKLTSIQAINNAISEVTEWQSDNADNDKKVYADKLFPVLVSVKNRLADF